MTVDILTPCGFCGGVKNVLIFLNEVVEKHKDQPIYCVGEIVHNKDTNDDILKKGVKILTGDKEKIIDTINEGVVVFSAHGTDEALIKKAKEKGLIVYDSICPFVKKSFDAIKNMHKEGYEVIYIGKKGHDEANAALSINKNIYLVTNVEDVENLNINSDKIAVINQTTLSIISIKDIYQKIIEKYPKCRIVDEICATTRLRQEGLISKAKLYDLIIVVGDKTSSNTMSLYNIARNLNDQTYLTLNEKTLNEEWLINKKSVLIVSGASTPNKVIDKIVKKIKIN